MKVIFNEAITYGGKADISYLAELIPAATKWLATGISHLRELSSGKLNESNFFR